MKHKLLRGLVAVVLVCVLLVSWSPIRAQAVTQDIIIGVAIDKAGFFAQAGAVSTGAAAFFYVALALGIVWNAKQAIEKVSEYMEWSGELETSIYYYPDGTWSYGVDVGFVDSVRAFLFDKGYLVDAGKLTAVVPEGVSYRNYTADGPCVAFSYSYSYYSTSQKSYYVAKYCYLVSTVADFKFTANGKVASSYLTYNDRKHYYCCIYQSAAYMTSAELQEFIATPTDFYYLGDTGTTYSLQKVINRFGWSGVCGAGDTVIDYVAAPDVSIDVGYPEWYVNSRPAVSPDTGEEVTVLPVPIVPSPDVQEFPDNLTQSEIWQGSIEAPPPGYGEDTDIDGDTQLGETPWENFKKWISEGWKSIIQAIPTADSIAEAFGNVIKSIFVPDADFITEKWNDIRSRFEFADSITATGEVLVDILDGLDPEPPVIYIDLGAAEGSYNIGGEVPFVDLRWYARYKPTMDLIISAFLWLAFVWRLILKLPGIISGMPGEFVLMNLPVNLPHLSIGSGQRREELESGRNNRRLGDGH